MSDLVPGVADAVDRVHRLAYSPTEAAQALGISRAKLYQLLEDGSLPSVSLGRRRLIRPEAITALLDSLEVA